jgi:hypothetical protein
VVVDPDQDHGSQQLWSAPSEVQQHGAAIAVADNVNGSKTEDFDHRCGLVGHRCVIELVASVGGTSVAATVKHHEPTSIAHKFPERRPAVAVAQAAMQEQERCPVTAIIVEPRTVAEKSTQPPMAPSSDPEPISDQHLSLAHPRVMITKQPSIDSCRA